MPESSTAITVPRPSQFGFAWTNWAACVSPIGMYGLIAGVAALGGGCGMRVLRAPQGAGRRAWMIPSTSTAATALSRAASSACSVGISTLR